MKTVYTDELRAEVIRIAYAEVGVSERPENSNKTKYGKWFGFDGVPWCGIFVSWCFAKAGAPLGNIGFLKGFAGCQTAVAHFKKKGQVVDRMEAQPGDIVFFDWNRDGRYDHVGIVKKIHDTYCITIEGNTSSINNSNGGMVMLRTRITQELPFGEPNLIFVNPFK